MIHMMLKVVSNHSCVAREPFCDLKIYLEPWSFCPLLDNFVNHNAHMFVLNLFQQINRFETNILTAYPFQPAVTTILIIIVFFDASTSKIGPK